jgi:2'-5' RNA ligase
MPADAPAERLRCSVRTLITQSDMAAVRYFVAQMPPPQVVQRLADATGSLQVDFSQARATASENLHLTLAFIGALNSSRAADVARNLQALETTPFTWTLERLAAFVPARIAWAGGAAPAELLELAAQCRALLDRLEVPYDRKSFVAHVTLLRDLPRRTFIERTIESISWPMATPVLMSSRASGGDVRYERVAARS